jgi:hypothetical protein
MMLQTRCYLATTLLWLAAAAPALADSSSGATQPCANMSAEGARARGKQLFDQGAYQHAGECYQAAGDLALANQAFFKALKPESTATERRVAEQRDQAKALVRQLTRGLR